MYYESPHLCAVVGPCSGKLKNTLFVIDLNISGAEPSILFGSIEHSGTYCGGSGGPT